MLAKFLFKCCSKDPRNKDGGDAHEIGGYGTAGHNNLSASSYSTTSMKYGNGQPTMLTSFDTAPPVPPTMLTTYGLR